MLFKRENFLEELVDFNPASILIVLSRHGMVVDFSDQITVLYGWQRAQIIQHSYFDICKQFNAPFSVKTILPLLQENSDEKRELLSKTLMQGRAIAIRWQIYSSKDQAYLFFSGIDLSWVEENSGTEVYLNSIIDNIPHYIFWKNEHSIFMGCNQAFARLVGLNNSQEICGKSDYDLPWTAEESELYIRDDRKIMESGVAKLNYEEIQTRPDGTQAVGLVSKVPILDIVGQVQGLLGIYTDITQRKRDEAELREAKENAELANQAKIDFILNMQHDIRTPLSGIYGMTELLAERESDAKTKEDLLEIVCCAKELLAYCNEIIDFSNIERGSWTVVKAPFYLRQLIDEVMALELPAANFKKLDFLLQYDPLLPVVVVGDFYRIKRVLLNLIGNAIKFTPRGFVKVRVDVERISLKEREVIIRLFIEDTGIGIPEEKRHMIYEKFSKIIASNKGLYKGSGLGLRIVKQFVEEMEGDIYIDSVLNKGTVVKIFLPLTLPLSQAVLEIGTEVVNE